MTCMWKGTAKEGGIICGKNPRDTIFTTDVHLTTCVDCIRLFNSRHHNLVKHRSVHLNADFLSNENLKVNAVPYEVKNIYTGKLEIKNKIVISFEDKDDTANHAIFKLMCTSASRAEIIFANGGDRDYGNVPELTYYDDDKRIKFVFGVGGENKKI